MVGKPEPLGATLLADGHVHLHPGVRVEDFLTHARTNLQAAARKLGFDAKDSGGGPWLGVLLLTEAAGVHRFREVREGQPDRGTWRAERTSEDASVLMRGDDGFQLLVIAGRQVSAERRLEVLALCTDRDFPEGRPLPHTIEAVRAGGAIPVLPWGFGKWWRGRGSLMETVVRRADPGDLFLGDNGGRLRGSREPRLFALARERGIGVIAGSDPLPFPREVARVGSYGSVLTGVPMDMERPSESVARALAERPVGGEVFGRRVGPISFFLAQVGMQLRRGR